MCENVIYTIVFQHTVIISLKHLLMKTEDPVIISEASFAHNLHTALLLFQDKFLPNKNCPQLNTAALVMT